MATSAFGVFLPIITTRFNIISQGNIVFVILKQFGTGIVLSTAFIHLFTHAELMFGNECLGELQYEGTTAAIFMAGLFLSFLADYLGARFVQWRQKKYAGSDAEVRPTETGSDKAGSTSTTPDPGHSHGHHHGTVSSGSPMEDKINVMNLEAGIIFHSIRKSIPRCTLIDHKTNIPTSHRYHTGSCWRHFLHHPFRRHPLPPDV
jgi:zinc transporter 1/2/3